MCVCARMCKVGFKYTTAYTADTHIAKNLTTQLRDSSCLHIWFPSPRHGKGAWYLQYVIKKKILTFLRVIHTGHANWRQQKLLSFFPPSILAYIYIIFLYIYMYKNKYIYIKKREKHIHTYIHTNAYIHIHTHTPPLLCIYFCLISLSRNVP